MDDKKIQKIKLVIAILVIVIILAIVITRILIYQKEGEKNMPFNLSKIIIISTAINDTTQTNTENQEQNSSVWNFSIIQTNDIYISIEENKNYTKKDEKIKNVTISNIQILQSPTQGRLIPYMPNSVDGEKYNYVDEYIVSDSLTYRGAEASNLSTLQIAKNGGTLGISFANKELGTYSSGTDTEITYNGTMLSKLELKNEDVKSKISFDLIIELDDGKKYSGNVELDLTCDGLVENGTTQTELTDFSNVIFKRI